jgi:hypothetical protein
MTTRRLAAILSHRGRQRVAVIRIAVQGPGMQHELTALGLCHRGGDAHLAPNS